MDKSNIDDLILEQKKFYNSKITLSIAFRKSILLKLKKNIKKYEKEILLALYLDLRKSEFEAYSNEVGLVYEEINYFLKNLDKLAKIKKVKKHKATLRKKGYIINEPLGSVLIISSYNYPFQLSMIPLVGAIAAGNTAIVKPSEKSINTARVLDKIIKETFKEEYVSLQIGDSELGKKLVSLDLDHIFFTGSKKVGTSVLKSAASNLTPVTLELGGKSPAIVTSNADIKKAAKEIIFGKFLNAGQTCVAPDYIAVEEKSYNLLLEELKKQIYNFYGVKANESSDYGRIIDEKEFERLADIIDQDKDNIVYGGNYIKENLYIEPTLIKGDFKLNSMDSEIFGPILPIVIYKDINKLIYKINSMDSPLSLYVFDKDIVYAKNIIRMLKFGGGTINGTILHMTSPYMPFGGVGPSGMGSYHGRYSFKTFSHKKAILINNDKIKNKFLYPPHGKAKKWILSKILK